jgi:hypothetical protein
VELQGTSKITKVQAGYEDPAQRSNHCKICEYFEKLAPRHCAKVEGIISPAAWCRLFERK